MADTPRQTPSSEDLVAGATRGDRASLERLLERYLPRLRAFVRARSDQLLRARESHSDLVQSVCRELLAHVSGFEFRGEDQFRSWLFTTALHKIQERARYWGAQKRATPSGSADFSASGIVDVYAQIHSPSQVAQGNELVAKMERALDSLSEDHREVITLSRIVGLPRAEIAKAMNRSEEAVRVLLTRALVALIAELDGRGDRH